MPLDITVSFAVVKRREADEQAVATDSAVPGCWADRFWTAAAVTAAVIGKLDSGLLSTPGECDDGGVGRLNTQLATLGFGRGSFGGAVAVAVAVDDGVGGREEFV